MSLDIALACAERGWLVHPCGDDKRPLTRWSEAATKDANEVRALWRRFPDALVGVVTGRKSNLYVIDIDRPGAEDEAGLDLGGGVVVATRREGGEHVLFSGPRDGERVRNSAADGLDVRGDGGFVISWHMPPGDTLQPLSAHVAEWARNRHGGSETGPAAALASVIEEGGRESALVSLAGSMRRRGAGEGTILAALREFNAERCRPPLDDEDLERIAGSVARYEAAEDPAQYANILAALSTGLTNADGIPRRDGNGAPTQMGIALDAIRTEQGAPGPLLGRALWRDDERSWYVCEGGIWRPERRMEVRATLDELTVRNKPSAVSSFAGGVERFARGRLAVDPEHFDQHPWMLGVANGVVDLRTGLLLAPDPDLLLSRTTVHQYKTDTTCPLWMAHLDRLFEGDLERVVWFQKAVGAALVGDATEKDQIFVLVLGEPGNGKGTAMRTLLHVLVQGQHAVSINAGDMTGRERHLQWMVKMRGVRIVIVEELRRSSLDVQKIKTLTGGDAITANKMRQEDQTWKPTHTLFMTSNHQPNFGGDTTGLERRYRPIPTGPSLSAEEMSPEHEEALRAEADGILSWAVEGCLLWQADGRRLPRLSIIEDTASDHLIDDDLYMEWADERVLFATYVVDGDRVWTSRKDLLNNVNDWRRRREWEALTFQEAKEFYAWLRANGAEDSRSGGTRRDRGFDVRILEGPGS